MRFWLLILLPLLLNAKLSSEIIHVDDDAATGGDGAAWASAYRHLQDALKIAKPYDEIWVASGTYKPDTGGDQITGDRRASFQLREQIQIYGGFLGNESSRTERDWKQNITILSGEISHNSSNWSYHVLKGTDTEWTLDGLLITKGNANGTGENGIGGGLLTKTKGHKYPRILNCTFRFNKSSSSGGGIAILQEGNELSRINLVSNCIFEENHTEENGGGLYIKSERGAPFHIHNCVFVKNSATNGGGLYVDILSRTHIVNSVFTKNEADGVGGGLLVKYTSLTNCTLEGNSAAVGGAMSLINYGAISNSIIWGNSASLTNPGIHIREGVADNLFTQDPINANPLSINNCLIEGGGAGNAIYGKTTTSPGFKNSENPAGPDQIWATADDGLRPTLSSAAINLGSLDHLPPDTLDLDGDEDFEEVLPIDLSGRLRTQDGKPDLGPYEFGDVVGKIPLIAEAKPEEGGNVEGGGYYEINRMTMLRAVPREGYVFTGWGGDATGARNPWEIQVNHPRKVHAFFEIDSDNDGIPDDWELAHGLNPNAADQGADNDNDRATNLLEYIYGTDPTRSESLPRYSQKIFTSLTTARYITASNKEEDRAWRTPGHPDEAWNVGTASMSLDPSGDYPTMGDTDLTDIWEENSVGLFIRISFEYEPIENLSGLSLRLRYNDGFVAYLNGVEVARSNAPRIIKWDSIAPEIRNAEVAITPETFDLSDQTDLLRSGQNLLAIHLLDADTQIDTLLLTATLEARIPILLGNGQGDNDNDGVTNTEEAMLGTSPSVADSDGDGYNDKLEWDKGSDPLDAQIVPPPRVEFTDPVLEELVRKSLNRPTGSLTTRELKELTVLEASGQGLTSLEGLQYAVNLRTLVIADYSLTDISPLNTLKKLESLQLLGTQASNLTPLENLKSLRELKLHQNKFTAIDALSNLRALQKLSLSEPNVTNVSTISGLTTLENLSVLNMKITEPEFLNNLGQLSSLNLSGNEIKDITPTANLQSLSTLLLYNNNISNLSPLKNLGNLRTLGLSGNLISELSPIAEIEGLQALSLAQNRIEEISQLSGLTQLRALDLSGNRISNASPLITLRNLLELRISQNRIQDPRPIADLSKLLDLRLQDNRMDLNNSTVQQAMIQLSDKGTFVQTDPQDRVIEIADNKLAEALRNSMGKPVDEEFTLSELMALDTIEAEGQGITSLDGLEHASNLRMLRLKNNRISDIEPILQHRFLQYLDLSHNPLFDISALRNHTNLEELRLDATLVNNIGELKKLGSLITLSLENAQIIDPSPLANLVNIEYLNLAGNYVNDLTPLRDLPALKTIQLNNNFLDLNPRSTDGTIVAQWRSHGIQTNTGEQESVRKPVLEVQWAIEMKWITQPGIPYQIYQSSDLETWTPYGTPIIGTGGTIRKLLSREGRTRRFYQVRATD